MNIYDIAKEAGVSIATISRVINGKSVVSPKTREKVEAVLKKHDYTPSEIARGLVVNSIRTIGVMTIDIRDIYYANVAYTVEQELSKLGYNVILSNTGNDTELKIRNMNTLLKKKVDSIILVGSVFKDECLDRQITAIAEKLPIIMINGFVDSENVYSVLSDDRAGMLKAVDYLAAKGKKNIQYLKDADTYSARSKVEGFRDGIEKNGLKAEECRVVKVGKGVDGGIEGVERLLSEGLKPDALLCGDDITAVGALRCLKKHGIKVPEDVSVIGFNNSVLTQCCDPLLTSVDSRMEDMGRTAVDVLIKVLEGENAQRKTILTPCLTVRESG